MSLTIVVKDERGGLFCPSASLFQNMDPGDDILHFNPSNINAAVEETFTSVQIALR